MSDWVDGTLSDAINSLNAGVSVNAEDRPHGSGEIGVLKTSALSGGKFHPEQNKAVLPTERNLVAEPVLADSILVSRMNTPALVGESCYLDAAHPTLFLPDRLWQLKPKDRDAVNMRWLSFVLQSSGYRNHIEIHATGTSGSMKNLPKARLLDLPVSYPPAHEQRFIAKVLDSLDSTIRQTEAIIEKLKQVKQGLLHDLLTRGIDANGELRPPQSEAPELYKESALGWMPKEWTPRALGTLADVSGGVTLGRSISGPGVVELPYLRVANVQDGYLDLDEIKTVQVLSSEVARYKLEPGDVLMNEGGDFDKLGRGVIWSGELEICLHQNHVFRVRCSRADLDPRYLAAYSASRFGKSYFVQASKQTTNLASINSTQLKAFPLMLPPPEEQRAIVEKLAGLDLRVESEARTKQKLLAQKSGLMDDLLTGCVRVTPLLESAAA